MSDRPSALFSSMTPFRCDEYKLMVLSAPAKALGARPGQFFQLRCPSPDGAEVWMRRPMSIYAVYPEQGRLDFLYKVAGRGERKSKRQTSRHYSASRMSSSA